MARKIAKRIVRIAAPEDESVRVLNGPNALGANEPQKETEKVTIPEDGEVQLQNSNILADSLSVTELKTSKEFIASDDQTFGPGKFFFMAEEGTLFFDPSDAGKRVQIEYLWSEAPEEEEEESIEGDSLEDDDGEDDPFASSDDDDERRPGKSTTTVSPADSLWHLDNNWFKWAPESKAIEVNDSLQAKLEKGADITRPISVTRVEKLRGRVPDSGTVKLPAPVASGHLEVKNLETNESFGRIALGDSPKENQFALDGEKLVFGRSNAGKRVEIVYVPKGRKGLHATLSGMTKDGKLKRSPSPGEVVYNYGDGTLHWGDQSASGKSYIVEYHLKGKRGKPLTLKDDEDTEYEAIEALKNRAENLWTHILDNPDPAFVRDTIIPLIENELENAKNQILELKSEVKKQQELKFLPDLTGELIELEQLLARREESDTPEERQKARQDARSFVDREISPKLSRLYSLASLISERIYDMQTETAKDEDFPEFGNGARSLDIDTLKYLKRVRQEANELDQDLVDFSKYYTGLLLDWITDPNTYYPGGKKPDKGKKKADPRWEGIKRVFENAGIGIADLQAVAMEAFRRAILGFDRERRDKETTPDPKKFRLWASPFVERAVKNAVKSVFDKYQQEQTVERTTRDGSTTIEVPPEGGEVSIDAPGFLLESLKVEGQDGRTFLPSDGVLLPAEIDARGSKNYVVIHTKGSKWKEAQLSVTNPETGEKLNVIRSPVTWSEAKKQVAEDPNSCYFAHSSGKIWLSRKAYEGKSLLVEAVGLSEGSGVIGKDEYRAHPTRGTIEFSSLNAGEKVKISFSQVIRGKRIVDPTPTISEDPYSGVQEVTRFTEMVEDENSDPQSQAEETFSDEKVQELLGTITSILTDEKNRDPRLTPEYQAILKGLLGIGEPGGARLSIQEIATRKPFNIDLSDKSKVNQLKGKREKAADVLLTILREKAQDNHALRKMIRPFETILLQQDMRSVKLDLDKFLTYLRSADAKDGAAFQHVLVGILGLAGLKQDEENILRWMWALPGKLRRDQDSEGKQHSVIPGGTAPADNPGQRLQEIAVEEFGIEVGDDGEISPAASGVINKVYERALSKFSATFNTVFEKRRAFFEQKFPKFVEYYDKQLGKQTLRDELTQIERDEYKVPPKAVRKPKVEEGKATPLFDQIKKSIKGGADEDMLRSLMKELVDVTKKGGDIHDLMKQRQKEIDALTEKGASLLDKQTKGLRSEVEELRKAAEQARAEVDVIENDLRDALADREKLREQAIAGNEEVANKKKQVQIVSKIMNLLSSWDTKELFELLSPKRLGTLGPEERKLWENYSHLYRASNDDLEEAQSDLALELEEYKEELKGLRKQAVELADDEIRKGLRKLKRQIEELSSKKDKFIETAAKQEAALDSKKDELEKKLRPLQKKVEDHLKSHNTTKELDLLHQVLNFFSDRDELQRGDGSFSIENMFEVAKPEKGTGYQPPRLAPGEEDSSWAPLPRQEVETPKVTSPKPILEKPTTEKAKSSFKLLSLKELAKQYTDKKIEAKIFLRRCSRAFEGRLPSDAQNALSRYKEDSLTEDEAAKLIAKSVLAAPEDVMPVEAPSSDTPLKFQPKTKEPPKEIERSLFDELQAVAVPLDPDETKASYKQRLTNFRVLMNALRKHFAEGKPLQEFKPKFSASQTLPDQNKAIGAVRKFLENFGQDLKVGPGVWDLKDLFKPTIVKPIEPLQKTVDLSDHEAAIEALTNAQPSLANKAFAKALHEMMRMVNKGTPISKIIQGLKKSGNPNAEGTLNLALRLGHFMALHEDLKREDATWDFEPLYTGAAKFPSFEEYQRSRPLRNQIDPLVKELQAELQEEAGAGGGIESSSTTQERVLDMLERMSELALHGMDLDEMGEHFEQEDKRGSKPYSLAYLFQRTRNFLNRLNQTNGLANMADDMGLGEVFGPGAPAGSPTEQDEVTPTPPEKQEHHLPDTDFTPGFREMVRTMDFDEKDAEVALRIVSALQLKMENGDKVAADFLRPLLEKQPKLEPIVRKILAFIGANRLKFESGIPGVPDFSYLTGMPFKHPAAEPVAPKSEASETEPQKKVERASDEDRKHLRKNIFRMFIEEHELGQEEEELFSDAIRALQNHGGVRAQETLTELANETPLRGTFELLVDFFKEKGLVTPNGQADFRGVVVPPLGDREPFFNEDGSPNLDILRKEAPEFDAEEIAEEDIDDEMPEPRADVEESAEDLADELDTGNKRLSPDLQEAIDFLKSDQVVTEEDAPRDSAKERLKKNIWNMMVHEFDFDAEEQQNAAEILETIQKQGLDKVRALLKGKGPAEVLMDDLVEFIREQGLEEADIVDIQLPQIQATDESVDDSVDEVDMTIEELMGDKPAEEKAPNRLTPTVRHEVDEDTLKKVLELAKKTQGKGLFETAKVVRSLEGKVSPEDAKNALLQGAEQGLVDLKPEAGTNSLSLDDARFVPVSSDGVPLSSGRVIRLPSPKEAPQPAEPAEPSAGEPTKGKRGRLPAHLVDRPGSAALYTFLVKHSGMTQDEVDVLNKTVPGLENQTYRQVAEFFKGEAPKMKPVPAQALHKYLKAFTSYLRLVEQGRDPLAGGPAPAPVSRPRGEWRNDPATEKQINKIQELINELSDMGATIPPVSSSPKTKGEAATSIDTLKRALEEANKQQAPAPTEPEPTPVSAPAEDKPKKSEETPSKDERLDQLLALGTQLRNAMKAYDVAKAKETAAAIQAFGRVNVPARRRDVLKTLAQIRQVAMWVLNGGWGHQLKEKGITPKPSAPPEQVRPAPAAPASSKQHAPAAPAKPAPAVAPSQQQVDRAKLNKLIDKALEWSTKNEVASARGFLLFLKKHKPELVSVYESVMPQVQKALDAIHTNALDFDLSDL